MRDHDKRRQVLPVAYGLAWIAALVVVPLGCDAGGVSDRTPELTFGSTLPDGYALRLDRPNRDPADFVVTPREGGLLIRTGPAGILFRPAQEVESGGYTVAARFTEIGAPLGHREGFGLFVGGRDLEGVAQRYTYFLVRGDGRYVVKHRVGRQTVELSDGWQPSEAVRVAAMEDGDVTNELSIEMADRTLRFSCNGSQVAEIPVGDAEPFGIVGIRVNHNLVVGVQGFRVEQ